jgi:hypothetical protein
MPLIIGINLRQASLFARDEPPMLPTPRSSRTGAERHVMSPRGSGLVHVTLVHCAAV